MITKSEISWLEECIRALNPDGRYPVRLRPILAALGVRLQKRVITSHKLDGRGEIRYDGGRYTIILFRTHDRPKRLTLRERFTIAHEIAHVLVDIKYGSFPTSTKQYWTSESICDEFAGRLLVPTNVLLGIDKDSSIGVLKGLLSICQACKVSLPVAAHRLARHYNGILLFQVDLTHNIKREPVFRVSWVFEEDNPLKFRRGMYLHADHPLGNQLMEVLTLRHSSKPCSLRCPGFPNAAAVLQKDSIVVCIFFRRAIYCS